MRPTFLIRWLAGWLLLVGASVTSVAQPPPLPGSSRINPQTQPLPPTEPRLTQEQRRGENSVPSVIPQNGLRSAWPRQAWTAQQRSSQQTTTTDVDPPGPIITASTNHSNHVSSSLKPPQTAARSDVSTASAELPSGVQAQEATAEQGTNAELAGRPTGTLDPPSGQFTGTGERPNSSSSLQMLVSVGSSLLLVIGLFLGVAWCYRKTVNNPIGGLPKQVVKVLGRTPLAPRQQLLLVRFGSKLVLVSMVQGEARTISEITDPLEVDQLAGLCESSQPGSISASFRSVLHQPGGEL